MGRNEYQLAQPATGSAMFGLSTPQLVLSGGGVFCAVVIPIAHPSRASVAGGAILGIVCLALALVPANGQPLYAMAPVAAGYVGRAITGRHRWTAPLPLLTDPTATQRPPDGRLPRCLDGLEIAPVPRPRWAGGDGRLAPVGIVRDARTGSLTVTLPVRGTGFSLLDESAQHARLSQWGQVLAQFARESSAVSRLGWTLWSAPMPSTAHAAWFETHSGPASSADDYRRLLADPTSAVYRHDLHLWVTIDPTGLTRRAGAADDVEYALAAAETLGVRCATAGVAVGPPLSPLELSETIRLRADPSAAAAVTRILGGLAVRAGLTPGELEDPRTGVTLLHGMPLSVQAQWNCVQIDDAWHRAFAVLQWPALTLDPRWLEPLLHAPPCPRALTVIYEPVSLRASRRRITAEAVAVESQLQLRDKHGVRVPVPLDRAHAGIDQREAELAAGHTEYGYLALLDVAGPDPDMLEANCAAVLEQAASCGITEVRPLHGRHDAAWACTLPIGRSADRALLHSRSR